MDLFRVGRVPYMARRNYLYEMQHLVLWGLFAGLVEGTVSAVIASKTFGGSILLITVVQATPAFANLVSIWWGAMLVGRRKLPAFMALAAASLAISMTVGFTPHTRAGGWIFAAQICLSRVFMTGVVTTRASLWKSNYPRSHRGRITANLQILRTFMSLPVILGGGMLFDHNPLAYRWFYPVVSVIGAASLFLRRRERVRGERLAMAGRENGNGEPTADSALIAPFSLVAIISPFHLFPRMWQVLKEDRRFARYCVAQGCIGSANLMAMPINTIVLTKLLQLSYTSSNCLLDIIPRSITIVSLTLWARLFDRMGVLRFRVYNSLCWCGSLFFCGIGALFAQRSGGQLGADFAAATGVYVLGRVFEGLAQSGGAIAWNIGHLHFAEDDKAELYMGIHVSLTGLRGLIAPFVGALLYAWIDWGVFAVGFLISGVGFLIFLRLAREESRRPSRVLQHT
jgi:hypothetical protein